MKYNFILKAIMLLSILVIFSGITVFAIQAVIEDDLSFQVASDYRLNYRLSLETFDQLNYVGGFFYPVPSILFRVFLSIFGLKASGIIWLIFIYMAVASLIVVLPKIFYWENHPLKYFMLLCAMLLTIYYIQWDIRAMNSNIINLCIICLGIYFKDQKSHLLSGAFFAASVALKVYSIVFLFYFLLRKEYSLAKYFTIWLCVYYILVPLIIFMPNGFYQINISWVENVLTCSAMDFYFKISAYWTSLNYLLVGLFTKEGALWNCTIVELPLETISIISKAVQFFWLSLFAVYFYLDVKSKANLKYNLRDTINITLLLLMVLFISPTMQPHHGALLVLPAAFFVGIIFSKVLSWPMRICTVVLILGCYILLAELPSGPVKGLGILIHIAVFSILLMYLRLKPANAIRAVIAG